MVLKAWLVSDGPYYECSLSIIAETRSRAKTLALWYGFRWNNETMCDAFEDWSTCWLYEGEN